MRVEPRFAALLGAAAMGLGLRFVGCGGNGSASTPGIGAANPEAGNGCGNTQADPHNCGACGHSCAGGACQAGACVPLGPGILASGQHTPGGIVADATNVYWVNRGTRSGASGAGAQVVTCAKSGCNNAPTVLATGTWTDVTNLALDGTNVYWGASGKLFACSIHGCNDAPTVLWSGAGGALAIAVRDASVYLDIPDSEQVTLCSTGGCDGGETLTFEGDGSSAPMPLSTTVVAIAADKDSLYAVATGPIGAVVACMPSHCAETVRRLAVVPGIGPGLPPFAPLLAVDDTNLYFVSFASTVTGITPPGPFGIGGNTDSLAELNFVGKETDFGSTGTLLADLSAPSAIAVDGTTVYVAGWGDQNDGGGRATGAGRIAKCAVAGCKGVPVTVQGYVNYPQGIAVDDANVYWTDFGSGTDPSGSDDGRVMFRGK